MMVTCVPTGPDGGLTLVKEGPVTVIPSDVVAVFERHGFIWGGRWAHFDTMHFEYRPELLISPPIRLP